MIPEAIIGRIEKGTSGDREDYADRESIYFWGDKKTVPRNLWWFRGTAVFVGFSGVQLAPTRLSRIRMAASVAAGLFGMSDVVIAAGSRFPHLALHFLFDHVAHLNFNFLVFHLVSADGHGAGLFNRDHFADKDLVGASFRFADRYLTLLNHFFFDVLGYLHLAGASFGFADGDSVLAGHSLLDVLGVLHLAGASFGFAHSDSVLFLDFFFDLLCDAHLAGASFRLTDGHVPGVLLFLRLTFVRAVLHFGFHKLWNPDAAFAGDPAAGATGNFHATFFPVTFIPADFASLFDGDHLADSACSHADRKSTRLNSSHSSVSRMPSSA